MPRSRQPALINAGPAPAGPVRHALARFALAHLAPARFALAGLAGLALVALAALAGCTNDPAPRPGSAPASRLGAAPSTPAAPAAASLGTPPHRLQPPAVVDGELSRVVAGTGNDRRVSTIRRKARADQEYWVHAACSSATPGKMLSIEVQSGAPGSSGNVLATVEIACDATPTANWIGTLPAELFAVYLRGDPSDVSSAYALVAPAESLRR